MPAKTLHPIYVFLCRIDLINWVPIRMIDGYLFFFWAQNTDGSAIHCAKIQPMDDE